MISTALVPIAVDFHASVAQTGWLIAGLYLASAIAQPTMGRLADLYGPRRVSLLLVLNAIAGLLRRFRPWQVSLVTVPAWDRNFGRLSVSHADFSRAGGSASNT